LDLRYIKNKIEPFWTLIAAPIIQELIFRYVPYRMFYTNTERYWITGIISSILFTAIHWYFKIWFIIYTFIWGLILWWIMARYGLLTVIVIHASVNLIHLVIGFPKGFIKIKYENL